MAQVLRLKLQALYCSRLLSSPALASKHLDARHIPWRCYGESALLTESCSSTLNGNDTDGDNKDTNGGESAKKGDGAEDKVSTESDLDKRTSSIYEKLRARVVMAGEEKANGFQRQADPLSTKESKKSVEEDKWDQLRSTVQSINLKKAKAAAGDKSGLAGDKSGLPKTQAKEDLHDFSDLDLPEAGGKSGDSKASSKSSLVMNVFGKCFKQKSSEPQFIHQQKLNDTESFSFLKSLDNNRTVGLFKSFDGITTAQTENSENKSDPLFTDTDFITEGLFSELKPSKLRDRNQLKSTDATPDGADSKMSKGKDSASPQAAKDGSSPQAWNQSRSKDTTQGVSDFKHKGSGDAPPAQSHGKSDATYQPSYNNNSVPRSGYMVCVHNIPASSNPALIKVSMAIHGEVLGFFKKSRSDHFNAYVQFKTEQGMENALAARKLQIGGKSFPILRTDPVFSTVVRLSKVSLDTTEKQLLSICQKYGSVDNIRKRSTGVYDVFYQVKELPNMTSILGSLNEVTHNRYTWLVSPAPTLHPSVQKEALKSPAGQAWHDMQVNQALNRIELGIDGVCVLFEDLKELTALGKVFSKR